MRKWCIFVLMLSLYAWSGCQESKSEKQNPKPAGLPRTTLKVKDLTLDVELAVKPEDQARGLMFRQQLGVNEGMLFVFAEPDFRSFWMKNVDLPLSAAFLKDDGTIINIEKMKPRDDSPRYWSKLKCRLVLEVNQGWFEKNNITVGDRIEIPPEATQGIF